MKKIALATVAAAAMAVAGGAHAYTSGTFSNGVVVPNVIHNGGSQTTAVGFINRSGDDRGIYWTFFDADSNHVTDGCFPMTQNQYKSFNWLSQSGLGLADQRGYLVFAVADPTTDVPVCGGASPQLDAAGQLSANAFFVDTASDDVAFTPVIDGDLTIAAADLTVMNKDSLTVVAGGAQEGVDDELHMRYSIAPGDTTRIMVWSTGDHSGTHTVNMYNDQQARKSVNFKLDQAELDAFDPASIPGLPADFSDGFIVWDASAPAAAGGAAPADAYSGSGGSIYAFSYVGLGGFGALQTLLGAHR